MRLSVPGSKGPRTEILAAMTRSSMAHTTGAMTTGDLRGLRRG